jgi:hypothetical protein
MDGVVDAHANQARTYRRGARKSARALQYGVLPLGHLTGPFGSLTLANQNARAQWYLAESDEQGDCYDIR